jgi:CheY-like chemotaxis protein
MLTELGYQVLKAKDAMSALTVIESGVHVDLLFTDVVMPGELKSPELARKVREVFPGTAVLFTSGYTVNSIVHAGKLDAGVELLTKPYTREALARKIRKVLGERRAEPIAEAAVPPPDPAPPASAPAEVATGLVVMLVEDEVLILVNSAEMLRGLGHRVIEAASAEAAVAALETIERLDVLITDLGLPGLSGTDLAMKAREKWPLLGVVIATGQVAGPAPDGPRDAIFLAKPYGADDMARAITAALPQERAERAEP